MARRTSCEMEKLLFKQTAAVYVIKKKKNEMEIYLRGPGGQYSFVALQNPDTSSCCEHKKPIKDQQSYIVNWLHVIEWNSFKQEIDLMVFRKMTYTHKPPIKDSKFEILRKKKQPQTLWHFNIALNDI